MSPQKTTLSLILDLTRGDQNVPVILAGRLLGRADQTTRNQLSLGVFPLPSFLVGRRRFVLADDLARLLDARAHHALRKLSLLSLLSKRI